MRRFPPRSTKSREAQRSSGRIRPSSDSRSSSSSTPGWCGDVVVAREPRGARDVNVPVRYRDDTRRTVVVDEGWHWDPCLPACYSRSLLARSLPSAFLESSPRRQPRSSINFFVVCEYANRRRCAATRDASKKSAWTHARKRGRRARTRVSGAPRVRSNRNDSGEVPLRFFILPGSCRLRGDRGALPGGPKRR